MHNSINIGLMTSDFILWRCLHGGTLNADSIMEWDADASMPWMELYNRNMPLLTKLTKAYGACAIIARCGEEVVGHLRFYPKIVQRLCSSDGLNFCLQQKFPDGPANDFAQNEFPPFEELTERTLVVHCIMTGSPKQGENPYLRRGVGTRMVQFLIDWARAYGWEAVEAKTHEDIPLLYAVSGCAGKTFWEKLNFRVIKTETEDYFLEDTDFNRALRDSAKEAGINPALVTNTYTMRIETGRRRQW